MASNLSSMQTFQQTSFLDGGSSAYLEQLYEQYLTNPDAVPVEWQHFFEQLPIVNGTMSEVSHLKIQEAFKHPEKLWHSEVPYDVEKSHSGVLSSQALLHEQKQIQVRALIDAYRLLGHLHAEIDPLHFREKPLVPELHLSYYHLSEKDFPTVFDADALPGKKDRPLADIISDLKKIYCGTIAFEFMHIPDSPERLWVQQQVEALFYQPALSYDIKRHILERLTAAEGLEKYLHAKYPGAKRFSLEGTDSLIVALDTLIQFGGTNNIKEMVICMAHRGRLNLLVNILGKLPAQLFDEFEGKHDVQLESGDVKYHQGFSSNVATKGGNVHLSLAFNPSHLEVVTPVVCGSVRARQDKRGDAKREQVLPIALHGDAAFAGQGVVMETLNMSRTRGFCIGGTLHIIVNNQIGFTISSPQDARSTLYCSDIGKMIEVPIFHVNADDAEAVYRVVILALVYREKFKKDVIIDVVGYRRQGHNEADEPRATQPLMYKVIQELPTARAQYAEKLIREKVITPEEVAQLEQQYRDSLDKRQNAVAKNLIMDAKRDYANDWQPYFTTDWRMPTKTAISLAVFKQLAEKLAYLPPEFILQSRVKKIMEERIKMSQGTLPIDWGYGETMAYASLLTEGYLVRLSGQDSARGTFFHRQAVLHDQETGSEYVPLQHLSENQASFVIVDSLLSEQAVLAFEYGFASTEPLGLVIWEAQFGDFANNAQAIVDQFISSGEQKWGRLCGLTLFLPHGYEGQGPEHSSARLERYLQLCAEHNMQVCIPSTPAQVFHMLRRQMIRPMRKPLIVMTPKSLLRHKLAVSSIEDFTNGSFFPILPEVDSLETNSIRRVILCSGKVYYEVLERRREANRIEVAIIRIEQLYPFPELELKAELAKYPAAREVVWCQEEPQNQGAWYSSQHHMVACLLKGQVLLYAGRKPSAAPAVGYLNLHQAQQEALVKEALG